MDIVAQVAKAREGALVVPATELAALVITGADRQSWLNGLVTCDVARLRAGDAAYGLVVAQKGRILSDFVVCVREEELTVLLPRSVSASVRAHFEGHLIMEDAQMASEEQTAGVRAWFVHGPRAGDVARAAAADAEHTWFSLDVTGLGGAVVLGKKEPAWDGPVGDDAGWNALRLERGVPRFGVDFDTTMYPQEASLEKRAVSFDKGCYLGQEVVCMLEMRGHVKRKLVPLKLASGKVPAKGEGVTTTAGEKIGEVTSAAESPTLGVPVALAMIKYAHASSKEELRVGDAVAKIIALS